MDRTRLLRASSKDTTWQHYDMHRTSKSLAVADSQLIYVGVEFVQWVHGFPQSAAVRDNWQHTVLLVAPRKIYLLAFVARPWVHVTIWRVRLAHASILAKKNVKIRGRKLESVAAFMSLVNRSDLSGFLDFVCNVCPFYWRQLLVHCPAVSQFSYCNCFILLVFLYVKLWIFEIK